MSKANDTIEVENFTSPGHVRRVNRAKYEAVRDAFLAVLPEQEPGSTVAEAKEAMLPHLPQDLFPGGDKVGWWIKCVQLDLEAKGTLKRAKGSPVRLFRVQ